MSERDLVDLTITWPEAMKKSQQLPSIAELQSPTHFYLEPSARGEVVRLNYRFHWIPNNARTMPWQVTSLSSGSTYFWFRLPICVRLFLTRDNPTLITLNQTDDGCYWLFCWGPVVKPRTLIFFLSCLCVPPFYPFRRKHIKTDFYETRHT